MRQPKPQPQPQPQPQPTSFKGNKSYLTSKLCMHCGREMTWRKSWAKNWAEIKYCSDVCRSAAKRGLT